jgi:hypothetical protein
VSSSRFAERYDRSGLAADDRRDQARAVERGDGVPADGAAVLHHRHGVGDPQDLAEPVRDEEHGDAAGAEAIDSLEHSLHLGVGEGDGGLVHDHESGVARAGAGDAHHPALGDAERCHRGGGIDVDEVTQHGRRSRAGSALRHERAAAREAAAEEHVLGDAQPGDEGDVLVDEVQAEGIGLGLVAERHLGAVDEDRARVALLCAGEDLDERRLARTVLADEPVHLPRLDGERRVVEGAHARELLAQAGDLDDVMC